VRKKKKGEEYIRNECCIVISRLGRGAGTASVRYLNVTLLTIPGNHFIHYLHHYYLRMPEFRNAEDHKGLVTEVYGQEIHSKTPTYARARLHIKEIPSKKNERHRVSYT
jgi:hypothetical protein